MENDIVAAIRKSGLVIYDSLIDRTELFIDNKSLEKLLNEGLSGFNLNYANRTRSKKVKEKICEILGYRRSQI